MAEFEVVEWEDDDDEVGVNGDPLESGEGEGIGPHEVVDAELPFIFECDEIEIFGGEDEWENELEVVIGTIELKAIDMDIGIGEGDDGIGDGEPAPESERAPDAGGFMRFSFCLRLQNQTLITSFSIHNELANIVISSEVGLGFCKNARSSDTLTVVSMLVRFFLRLPESESGVECAEVSAVGLFNEASASSSQRCNSGFNLHIFLNDKFNASKRDIVVWEKSFPYNFPIANPTSPCVNPKI